MGYVIERLPEDRWVPPWIRYQHLARYQWVAELTRGRRVIDAACGNGYGAHMLRARGALAVDGFDLCPEAIREAEALHSGPGLRFAVGDVTRLEVPVHTYDVFVSLETIEHIPDDEAFLAEVVRVLKPGGMLICSTPNRVLTNPGIARTGRPFNPFHMREYTQPQLDTLLRGYFTRIDWFGQSRYRYWYAGLLNQVGRWWPRLAVRLHQARKVLTMPLEKLERHYPIRMPLLGGEPEVLVALCTAPHPAAVREEQEHGQPLARLL